ncbi:MAG TPA: TIGR00730 family Rossman fold protein [Anaerolineaceae bacterium]|nr:TIGR00730 family Rossman fold protein [Anaerolineaceae bacterium]
MPESFRKNITVYAGSADHLKQVYLDAAWLLGETLAKQGRTLVFGAGKTGLMGAVADGALAAGGKTVGVINDELNLPHLAHAGLSELEILPDIHTRQARMTQLADGIIALPGGFGTFAELFEALTWAQIGLHNKPVGLLNVAGYFDPLVAMIEKAIEENYIYPEHRGLFYVTDDPALLLALLDGFTPSNGINRWVERP